VHEVNIIHKITNTKRIALIMISCFILIDFDKTKISNHFELSKHFDKNIFLKIIANKFGSVDFYSHLCIVR